MSHPTVFVPEGICQPGGRAQTRRAAAPQRGSLRGEVSEVNFTHAATGACRSLFGNSAAKTHEQFCRVPLQRSGKTNLHINIYFFFPYVFESANASFRVMQSSRAAIKNHPSAWKSASDVVTAVIKWAGRVTTDRPVACARILCWVGQCKIWTPTKVRKGILSRSRTHKQPGREGLKHSSWNRQDIHGVCWLAAYFENHSLPLNSCCCTFWHWLFESRVL